MNPISLLGTLRTSSYHYAGLARYTQDAGDGAGGNGRENTRDDTKNSIAGRAISLEKANNMLEANVNHKFELLERLNSIESTIGSGLNRSVAAQKHLDENQKRLDQKIDRWMYLIVGGLILKGGFDSFANRKKE